MKFFLFLLLAKSIYILLTKASAKLSWHHLTFIFIEFFKLQIKIPSLFQCFPESRGPSYNESKMNITSSSQNLDTTKALCLWCAQWKHCSCGISIGNIVLVVFFNGKTITVTLLNTAGNTGWDLVTNAKDRGAMLSES
jgi:hypothetical protein